jgi:DNA-binding NarL/FixJ family response regulator
VLVVDDHPTVREGLLRLLGLQKDMVCCGQAAGVKEAQTAVAKLLPDLVILDLRLKAGDGLSLIKTLKAEHPGLRILVLSQYDGPMYIERALRAGALGYVVKDEPAEDLLRAMRIVLAGEVYLRQGVAALLLHKLVAAPKPVRAGGESLSDRELHVLQLLGSGLSTRAVATELHLSFKTVETYRDHIKRKLGLRNASELTAFASRWAQQQLSLPQEDLSSIVNPRRQL